MIIKYKKYLYIFFIILCIFILIFINNKNKNIEHFCKISKDNSRGAINNKEVLLNYAPQSNIITSSCDRYWKDWPVESNSMFADTEPLVMKLDQLSLPKEKSFGNNSYKSGLTNFYELANIINDKLDFDIIDKTSELLVSPIDNKKLKYKYEFDYIILELNKKTWINRWEKYNPSIKIYFNYDEIKSSIKNVNILNLNFQKRCNVMQKKLLTDDQLILFGLINFDIFKYKILDIKYLNNNIPVYFIQIAMYREFDLYLNTFSYIGYIENNKIIITKTEFIGINSTDNVLLPKFYNKNDINQEIINNNFSNTPLIEKDPDVIVAMTKQHMEDYKLKNQYACFNLNYNPALKNENLLPYYSRESCESGYDPYGRPKNYGIFDKPCNKDEECPYFKINKNYENELGKCVNGTCQLPLNMINIGYKYFKTDKTKLPLCYNCKSNKFEVSTLLDTCCEEQFDKKLYPFLKSPDYAFENDSIIRRNYFNKKFCKQNKDTLELNCEKIELS